MGGQLPNIIQRVRVAALVEKARAERSYERHTDALASLQEVFQYYGTTRATKTAPILANLLYADLSARVENETEAVSGCVTVLRQLTSTAKWIRTDSKKYIMLQCKWILINCANVPDSCEIAKRIPTSLADIRLSLVNRRLITTFPMSSGDADRLEAYLKSQGFPAKGSLP